MTNCQLTISLLFIALLCYTPSLCAAADDTISSTCILLLPFDTIGIDYTTGAVAVSILGYQLTESGATTIMTTQTGDPLPSGAIACYDLDCASELARQQDVDQVIFGSISRLGEKRIVRVSALKTGETSPFYMDQLSALSDEDLEAVMIRIAESITAGLPNSDQATVESVIEAETRPPRLRKSRGGLGARAGFLFPVNHSYGKADRLTSLRFLHKIESRHYFIETTALTEWAWGDDQFDWTLFSIYGARILSKGDVSPYTGFGMGIHVITLDQSPSHAHQSEISFSPDRPLDLHYSSSSQQTKACLVLQGGVGLLMMRTFDYELFFDIRYRLALESFEDLADEKAHGIMLTFGTNG